MMLRSVSVLLLLPLLGPSGATVPSQMTHTSTDIVSNDIVTTIGISPVGAATNVLNVAYKASDCSTALSGPTTGLDVGGALGTNVNSFTITNTPAAVIAATSSDPDPPENTQQTATYCMQMTLCAAALPCIESDLLDILEVVVTYQYTTVGAATVGTGASGTPNNPDTDTESDTFGVNAFFAAEDNCASTTTAISEDTAFEVCVDVDAADQDEVSIVEITGLVLESVVLSTNVGSFTFVDTSTSTLQLAAIDCTANSNRCSVTVTKVPDFFFVNPSTGNTETAMITGTITAQLIVDGRRVRRRLSVGRKLNSNSVAASASLSARGIPQSRNNDPDKPFFCDGVLGYVFFWICWIFHFF